MYVSSTKNYMYNNFTSTVFFHGRIRVKICATRSTILIVVVTSPRVKILAQKYWIVPEFHYYIRYRWFKNIYSKKIQTSTSLWIILMVVCYKEPTDGRECSAKHSSLHPHSQSIRSWVGWTCSPLPAANKLKREQKSKKMKFWDDY